MQKRVPPMRKILRRSEIAATNAETMSHPLEELREAALREIAAAPNEQSLEAVRIRYLGRSGSVSAWSEQMKSVGKEERPVVGKLLNEARAAITTAIEESARKLRVAGNARRRG
jgi:phenylalanyl-tRNA synthetase alpha chain